VTIGMIRGMRLSTSELRPSAADVLDIYVIYRYTSANEVLVDEVVEDIVARVRVVKRDQAGARGDDRDDTGDEAVHVGAEAEVNQSTVAYSPQTCSTSTSFTATPPPTRCSWTRLSKTS
jgi:hypothetical protein